MTWLIIVGGLERRFPPVGLMRSFATLQPNFWKKRPSVSDPLALLAFYQAVTDHLDCLLDFYGVPRSGSEGLVSRFKMQSQFQSFRSSGVQQVMITVLERGHPAFPDQPISLQMCWGEIASSPLLSTSDV